MFINCNYLVNIIDMVESASVVMEDATYEKNVYVMKDTCIQRKSQVSEVYYSVNLALPRGDFFGG